MCVSTKCIPIRATIWIMCFTCTLFLHMLRMNLSIIIRAMVEHIHGNITYTVPVPECKKMQNIYNDNISTDADSLGIEDYGTRYHWNSHMQGLVLSSYFWGFILSGIPGGALAEKFGPSKCVSISFLISGLLTLIAPWIAPLSHIAFMILRLFIGLFGGVVIPSLYCLVARWAPPNEKGKFIGALLGGSLGTVIIRPLLEGIITQFGWIWAFVASGIIAIAWTVSWWFCVTDLPEQHPYISDDEKNYIVDSLKDIISNVKRRGPASIFRQQIWTALETEAEDMPICRCI